MFNKFLKIILLILVVGCSCGAQSKECYSCQGISCLRTSKITNKATCIDPVDSCVTVFEGLTVVTRGCYSTLPEEHRSKCDNMSNPACNKCFKSLCNEKGAISCLQCTSDDNPDCYSGLSKIESIRCPISTSSNSYCYTRQSLNKIERGCLIDTNEQLKCISDSLCEMCMADGKDTCNKESFDIIESSGKRTDIYSILLSISLISFLL